MRVQIVNTGPPHQSNTAKAWLLQMSPFPPEQPVTTSETCVWATVMLISYALTPTINHSACILPGA